VSDQARQQRIVILGKGGVGKSTLAANLGLHLALAGRSVLHVGCDPKADSSLLLVEPGTRCRTVLELLSRYGDLTEEANLIINGGRHGIRCVEVGGPEPGIGCGGRGVARAVEILLASKVLASGGFDVVLFDVLGDVVCGGFAAPLRRGLGEKVLIVVSPDEMSLFAANNICRAVVRYADNGVKLAGLVVNRGGRPEEELLDVADFARQVGTRILGVLPRSDDVG
jgi:nitrogenase iron protein NifH